MITALSYRETTGKYAVEILFVLSLVLLSCSDTSSSGKNSNIDISEPPEESPPSGPWRLRTIYVPAYSQLPFGPNQERRLFSILLSIRNVDSTAEIVLTHVDYFDTSGHRVRQYLQKPRKLRPLETVEFKVETLDDAGGSGANFLVYWEGPADAHSLLTESIMWGHTGSGYSTFTSRGVELDRRPDSTIFKSNKPSVPPVQNNVNEKKQTSSGEKRDAVE